MKTERLNIEMRYELNEKNVTQVTLLFEGNQRCIKLIAEIYRNRDKTFNLERSGGF